MENKSKTKEDIYFAVCNSILKYEVKKGHLSWTLSDISRDSGVNRSLIYYYFSSDKNQILEEAYKFVSNIFFSSDRSQTVGVRVRIKQVLRDMQSMPYLFVLYYLQKNRDTDIGKLIKKSESDLIASFKRDYPHLQANEALKVYLMELGAIAYQLPVELADEIFKDYDLK